MKLKIEEVNAHYRVQLSEAMANGFIVGIDNCSENERPLTQIQQCDLLSSMFLEFHSSVGSFSNALSMMEDLRNASTGN